MEHTQLLIIGSGPAGYTAAIYALRAGLTPILLEGNQPGGQLTQTTTVENFPGFPEGIEGYDLMENMRQQAERLGADMRYGACERVDLSARPFHAWTDEGKEITADTIIIATGASAKYLGLEGERVYAGAGVSACATCDGFFYRNKRVAVVGGGDTACEEANYLAGLAERVYLIVRKPYLRASQAMQKRVLDNEKIEVLFEHATKSLYGDGKVQGITVQSPHGDRNIALDGFFLAIGHKPNSQLFKPWVETDETGYIKTLGATPRTNVAGVFAAGDVADPTYRQAVIAAASGAKAAMEAKRFLDDN